MKKLIKIASLACAMLVATNAFATVTYSVSEITGPYAVGGKSKQATGKMVLAGTYTTNGFTINPASFGLSHIQAIQVQPVGGYVFYFDAVNKKMIAYRSPAVTPSGTVSSTFTGNVATIVATGTVAAPVFTGTPATITPTAALAASPEVTIVHTASTAGMSPVYYDTADGKLKAVFGDSINHTFTATSPAITVTGAAYTPAGTNSAPAFTGTSVNYTPSGSVASTFTGAAASAAALSEVTAGVSLSGVTAVNFTVIGW